MITVCLTYFRGLTLGNLDAALFSVRQQDFSCIKEVFVVDNNTQDSTEEIQGVLDRLAFPVPITLRSYKHNDPLKTHSWSTNVAVREATTPWVFFTRADYLLDFTAVRRCVDVQAENRFIVGGYYDIGPDIIRCEQTTWRTDGPKVLRSQGTEFHHVLIDAGMWMTTRAVFESVGGMDESLHAWGHSQTVFQHRLYQSGVEFVRIPEVLFYHIAHNYESSRDHSVASQQIRDIGLNIKELWARYDGPDHPYR